MTIARLKPYVQSLQAEPPQIKPLPPPPDAAPIGRAVGFASPQDPLSNLGNGGGESSTSEVVKSLITQITSELSKDSTLLNSLLKVMMEGMAKNDSVMSNFTKSLLQTLLTELMSNNQAFRDLLNSIMRELHVLVGPLVEADAAFREYYDEQNAYDADGTLVKIQSIKKISMVDANEQDAEFNYAQPTFTP